MTSNDPQQKSSAGVFDMYTDPRHCSVNDPTHSTCFLDAGDHDGFYESSPMVVSAALLDLEISIMC